VAEYGADRGDGEVGFVLWKIGPVSFGSNAQPRCRDDLHFDVNLQRQAEHVIARPEVR
jgi:hypothetical protein